MNWYKKAQANTVDPYNKGKTYLEIGHDPGPENEIWIWDRGKLFTDSGYSSHSRLIAQLKDSGKLDFVGDSSPSLFDPPIRDNVQGRYEGRFDNPNGEKMVSIKSPGWGPFQKVSPQLIRDLQSEYGDDIEIHIF